MIKLKSLIEKSLLTEVAGKIEVPSEPGTVPIPSNHLRLYHYTHGDLDQVKKHGLKLSQAQGHTYGEPDVVWASLQQPGTYKNFVEFSMAINDPRFNKWLGAAPDPSAGVEFYKGRGNDFTIMGDINPSEFIAVHEPWHHTYRYIVDEPDGIENTLKGEYDYLLIDDRNPNEKKAILAIKHNFGKI